METGLRPVVGAIAPDWIPAFAGTTGLGKVAPPAGFPPTQE